MTTITPASVFVVSGGAKGITARCVEVLARRYHCKFLLLGRSKLEPADPAWAAGIEDEAALKKAAMSDLQARGEKPTPPAVNRMARGVLSRREITGTLDAVQAAGGQAEYASVDITDAASVRGAIGQAAATLGPPTGIIHGAGVLADKLIEAKSRDDFEMVYATKVTGLENLLAAVDPARLSHLVLFSSVAGFYGNVGQSDYALANEVLNKAAHTYKATHPHTRVVSINWGPWDAGMVTPQLKAYFAEHGVRTIPIEVGAQMLVEELEAEHGDSVQVVAGNGIASVTRPIEATESLQTYTLNRHMELRANPFLQDHVVDGKAVLPMVCGMSWMSNAGEGLYPGYKAYGFEDYRVLKGIVFDDNAATDYTLQVKEVSKDAEQVTFDAVISSKTAQGKPRFHYGARIFMLAKLPERPVYQGLDLTVREDIPGQQFYDDYTLFHNFAFQGVERVLNISREKVTMQCRLPVVPPYYQGQFPVQSFNYYMTDIGFQSMGIYAKYFYGAGSLPLKAGGGEHYADVPWGEQFYVTLEIKKASETGLVTKLNIHDIDGNMYMIVDDGEITISDRLNDLFTRNQLPERLG